VKKDQLENTQQVEEMQRRMIQEREEAEQKRMSMMKKEIEMREQKDFMQYLKNTESKII
jgi:hypothetical protein